MPVGNSGGGFGLQATPALSFYNSSFPVASMIPKKRNGRPCTRPSGKPGVVRTFKIDADLAVEWDALTELAGDCRSTLIEGWIRRYCRKRRRRGPGTILEKSENRG